MQKPLLELKGFLSFLILHELGKKSLCGEDLAKKIGRRKGSEQLTPGTIYPALKELRGAKLIEFTQFGRKKMYSLTPEGEKELAEELIKEWKQVEGDLNMIINEDIVKFNQLLREKDVQHIAPTEKSDTKKDKSSS